MWRRTDHVFSEDTLSFYTVRIPDVIVTSLKIIHKFFIQRISSVELERNSDKKYRVTYGILNTGVKAGMGMGRYSFMSFCSGLTRPTGQPYQNSPAKFWSMISIRFMNGHDKFLFHSWPPKVQMYLSCLGFDSNGDLVWLRVTSNLIATQSTHRV